MSYEIEYTVNMFHSVQSVQNGLIIHSLVPIRRRTIVRRRLQLVYVYVHDDPWEAQAEERPVPKHRRRVNLRPGRLQLRH